MDLKSKKILITGTSAGLGKALVKQFIKDKSFVFGIARRKKLLRSLHKELHSTNRFSYMATDISKIDTWPKVIRFLKSNDYIPDIIILNAAIFDNDSYNGINSLLNRQIFETNYFSALKAIETLLPYVPQNSQFVAISTLSAFKGSGEEGVGYAASKAALSISFESLAIKYRNRYRFKTVYFGPIKTGMNPFSKHSFFTISEKKAVNSVIKAIVGPNNQLFVPQFLFTVLLLSKNISMIYFQVLSFIDFLHRKNRGK